MKGSLSAMLATLKAAWRTWLKPRAAPRRRAMAFRHIVIASHQRRYPGRSDALTLRQGAGWIDARARLAHQDRRA